ncbi:histidine phosphatase family protein [Comamonas testosteroni]|uniref:histidine phosphatase family protein n=1 Tax=Comamonas testosteroni TaxID=285 RepID=UPI0015F8BE55|nr:histidine phosphatase family protein [Comamonas testosteroni]
MRTMLTLLCAQVPPALRAGHFPDDDGLDTTQLADASLNLSGPERHSARVICSSSRAAQQTAQAMGINDYQLEPALKEVDYGLWSGVSLKDIEPQLLGTWLRDPSMSPPNGESLDMVCRRTRSWFEASQHQQGMSLVFTHANVIKALVLSVLGAPMTAMFHLDIAPLSLTRLTCHQGRWQVQCLGVPLKHQ